MMFYDSLSRILKEMLVQVNNHFKDIHEQVETTLNSEQTNGREIQLALKAFSV